MLNIVTVSRKKSIFRSCRNYFSGVDFVDMGIDKRNETRVNIAIDFNLDGGELEVAELGCTRDISESGIYFVTNIELTIGSLIGFGIEYEAMDGWKMLKGVGRILRIDFLGDQVGGAARIIEAQFEESSENIYLRNDGQWLAR